MSDSESEEQEFYDARSPGDTSDAKVIRSPEEKLEGTGENTSELGKSGDEDV